jgi:hypothetical protein
MDRTLDEVITRVTSSLPSDGLARVARPTKFLTNAADACMRAGHLMHLLAAYAASKKHRSNQGRLALLPIRAEEAYHGKCLV